MRKTMNDGTDTVKARVRKVRAGQGDVAARSIGGGKRRAMMAGWHRASIADSAGQSRASTFSRSRDAGTAILLNANWLPRDARAVVSLNAHRPEIVEAQLPLDHLAGSMIKRVVGSLPLTMKPSAGPYTSLLFSHRVAGRALTGSLQGHGVATLIPRAPSLPCRTRATRASLTSRCPGSSLTSTRALGIRVTPPPTPSQGRGTLAVNVLTLSSSSSPTITISCRETGQASRHRSSPSLTMEVTTNA